MRAEPASHPGLADVTVVRRWLVRLGVVALAGVTVAFTAAGIMLGLIWLVQP